MVSEIVNRSGSAESLIIREPREGFSIRVERGSNLSITIIQDSVWREKCRISVEMRENSHLELNLFTFCAEQLENNICVELNGTCAECILNGIYIAKGNSRISTHVDVNHNVGECHSNQLFKGIVADSAITKFNGRITVLKDAQKTEAYQANNNLLLSESARAYTQPHLVINADDVKCSHGATVGSLNSNELFYMRTRGISLEEAKRLQQLAFVYAVPERMQNAAAKEEVLPLLEKALRG